MSQNVPKARTCTKQYCHTVLDVSIKGVQCPYHTEQAKSAKKRQRDNKYAQSIIAAPSTQVHKPLNLARGKQNPLTNCTLIVELPSQMIIDSSGDEKPQVKHLKVCSTWFAPSIFAQLRSGGSSVCQPPCPSHAAQPFNQRCRKEQQVIFILWGI